MAARFDPIAALKASPPSARLKKGSVFDHPRIREWLRAWIQSGEGVSYPWMVEQIQAGAKLEGIELRIPVTASNLHRYVREGNGRDLVRSGKVQSVRRPRK